MHWSFQGLRKNPIWRIRRYFLVVVGVFSLVAQGDIVSADSRFDLTDYRGKVVLIDFWASWCGPCKRSFPWMNEMHAKYANDGLVIVAINVDNDPNAAKQFLADYPATFAVHFDNDKSLARRYEVVAMPSSFLIGRDGQMVETHLGFRVMEQDDYEAAIQSALEVGR